MDVRAALAANSEAVRELIGAAERLGASWTVPRAPGKWSPSQLVEHVARAIEESANVVAGSPSKFPTLPIFVRPLARVAVFRRVLKAGAFPKAKTNKAMDPEHGPATPADARVRLSGALERFDHACRACAERTGVVHSTIFGRVSVNDYARFIAIHTKHHCGQLP